MSRKKKLQARAYSWACSEQRYRDSDEASRIAAAFESGYRVALRDMRKAIANAPRNSITGESYPDDKMYAVSIFLEPLR